MAYAEKTKIKKSNTRKGKLTVKDAYGNCFLVEQNDNRFLSGELVSVMKGVRLGKKHSKETCNKRRMSLINRSYEDLHGQEKALEIKSKLSKLLVKSVTACPKFLPADTAPRGCLSPVD